MLTGVVAAVLLQAAPVVATPEPVTRPRWISRPSTIDIMRAYPEAATQERIPSGDVVLDCRFGAAGDLQDCVVSREAPADKGMGPAALKLAPLFKADVFDVTGAKVEGRRISIPMTLAFAFAPPPLPPLPPPALRQNGPGELLAGPSIEDFMKAYPPRAAELRVEGLARLSCKSTTSGRLNACEVLAEDPEGWGFGEAALSLASKIRMRFRNMEGDVMDGGAVRIPMRFTVPREPPPPTAEGRR